MDNGTKKIQWSKFSPDRSEQYVIRVETYEELEELRELVLKDISKTKAFPDDEGSSATPVEKTQESVPFCGIHKLPLTYRPAGISKTGNSYPAFWSCQEKDANGRYCTYRPK